MKKNIYFYKPIVFNVNNTYYVGLSYMFLIIKFYN